MSIPKFIFGLFAISLVGLGGAAYFKNKSGATDDSSKTSFGLNQVGHSKGKGISYQDDKSIPSEPEFKPLPIVERKEAPIPSERFPEANEIDRFFSVADDKFPIVETIVYSSRVPWLKGRPAWLADYANYFSTSRHFIARSLNRKADYFTQQVYPGSQFNVFKKNKQVEFHLVVDLELCKMAFYYYDATTGARVHVKSYNVGLGKAASQQPGGYLTPLGTFKLGDKIAVYKPGVMGFFGEKKVEMIQVFGTRWLPFLSANSSSAQEVAGLGIHGAPWKRGVNQNLIEDRESATGHNSDGSISLAAEDIEEIFSVVVTKPTFVHIVKNYKDAALPGEESRKN